MLPVLNGAVVYVNGTTHLGSEITYNCTRNYRLNGVTRRYCLDNGQWSDATPKCEGILLYSIYFLIVNLILYIYTYLFILYYRNSLFRTNSR